MELAQPCYGASLEPKPHPHAEATYRVLLLEGGMFGVEVVIPETYPTTVSAFPSEAEAEAWIARHKNQVALRASYQRAFGKARAPRG